ncbi:MAG: hypothetical protein WDM80_08245 [Limisphaerales bacterium]
MKKRASLMMFQDTGFLLWLILVAGLCSASAGDYKWLRTAGGTGAEVSRQIVVDDAGSSYIIGGFNSSNCPFGSIVLTNSLRSASPTYDVFVVKYDTKGSVVWARKFGGTNDDRGSGIAVDASHQCYITGYFVSTNFIIGGVTLTNYAPNGNSSLFVAKLDATGNVLWAWSPRSNNSASGSRIVMDSAGNSYVAGTFSGTNYFGGTNLVSRGNTDALLLKYDSTGALLWAQQAGGNYVDGAAGLAMDGADNVYLLANIRSTNAAFGSYVFSVIGTNTCQNLVVAKYNPSGSVLWAKLYGGTDIDAGTGITIGPNTNCYITGIIRSTNMVFGSTTLSASGTTLFGDIFVAHLNSSGNPVAAWTVQGEGTDGSSGIAVDQFGDCYIAGFFQSTNLVFNSGWLGSVTLTNSEANFPTDADAFIAEFDGYGNVMHTFQPTGVRDQQVFSIALDATAIPYVTGWTMGTNVVFGSFATTNAYLDMFVTKLDPNYPLLRMDDGASSPLSAPGRMLLSWPLNQTGSDAAYVEVSTNFITWSNPPGYVGSIYGGGRRWLEFDKLSDRAFYRLRFGN